MSAETYPYYLAHWPLSDPPNRENGLPALQGDIQDEFDQQTLLTGALPMVNNGELDHWIVDHFGWDGELASKPETASQQYLHVWDGLDHGHSQHDSTQASDCQEATTLLQLQEAYKRHPVSSELATERALFIAHPAHALAFSTFTGSPISEPCGTPDTSQAPSMMWETDPESEDIRLSRSPASAMVEQPSFAFPLEPLHDDDCLIPLEMPDGSLRMSSNWLPVDTTAGFTIGSHTTPTGRESKRHMPVEELDDIRDAFISADSASWKFHR